MAVRMQVLNVFTKNNHVNQCLTSCYIFAKRRRISPMSHLVFVLSSLLNHLHSSRPVKQSGTREYDLIMGDLHNEYLEYSTRPTMMQLLPSCQQQVVKSTTNYISLLDHEYTNIPPDAIHCSNLSILFRS